MKQIRMNVFETNSSSTHSISIYKGKFETGGSIPVNGKIMSNDLLTAYDCEFNDELRKLSHVIGLIAWYVDSESFNCESLDEVLNLEISKPFKWIADVVKEVRNTELIYVQSIKYSPFIQPVSDDEDNIENILKCDLKDENSFKTLIKDIIFNPEYIIYDKENEQ